ncbi:11641_t:CDS:2, partial [Funneliformis caledonium]
TTATSSCEQELLEEVASLHFDVVVSPKRTKGFKWTVNIEDATLKGLKEYIQKIEKPPALENDSAVLKLISDGKRYSPWNDQDLCKVLRLFILKKNFKFTVFIETPSKPFNELTFPKVCELYELSDDPNPDIDVYSAFSCGTTDLSCDKSKAVVNHLMAKLNLRKKTTPLILAYESWKNSSRVIMGKEISIWR